jgi:hypothetical protein
LTTPTWPFADPALESPAPPSVFDMDAMEPTVRLAKRFRKPAFFLVNKGRNSKCGFRSIVNAGIGPS